MFGREIRLPIDNELESNSTKGSTTADVYMSKILPKIKLIHDVATANVEETQHRYKERYDRTATPTDYQPGALLWLYTPPRTEKGQSKKLQIRYNRLVYVKTKCGCNTYKVIDNKTHIELDHPVHSDKKKPNILI